MSRAVVVLAASSLTGLGLSQGIRTDPPRGSVEWRIEQLAGVRVGEVRTFLARLKDRVSAGDYSAVCALGSYPMRVMTGQYPEDVADAESCVAQYPGIFDTEVSAAIAAQRFEDLFVSWQGIRIGATGRTMGVGGKDVWVAGICRDSQCREYGLKITSVNAARFLDVAAPGLKARDVLSGPLSGWITLPRPPSDEDIECTGQSALFWSTSLRDHVPYATRIGVREHVDPLPFEIPPARDREGDRWVARVHDGWIVGFSMGEFGGGLWWFSRNGSASRRIRPPAAPADEYMPENVLGLPTIGGEQLVLMGLGHLGSSNGAVFRLERAQSGWFLVRLARHGEPDPWMVDGNRLFYFTPSGLWSVRPQGLVKRVHETEIYWRAPSAMVAAPDGAIYVGLRHYVVKLTERHGRWRETWLAPAACRNVEMRLDRCECAG